MSSEGQHKHPIRHAVHHQHIMYSSLRTVIIASTSIFWFCLQARAQSNLTNPQQDLSLVVENPGLLKDAETSTIPQSKSLHLPQASEVEWADLCARLNEASSTYTETWDDVNGRTLHGGAYLGNGDFGIHLGGTKHSLVYYLGKNGFHAGNNISGWRNDGKWTQHILNLAVLTIEKSTGTDSDGIYSVTQDIGQSEIRTRSTLAGQEVHTKAYMAPRTNAMVVELWTTSGKHVPLQVTLAVMGNQYVAKTAGHDGGIGWVTKDPNPEGAPFYVKGAVAAKVFGADATVVTDNNTYSRFTFSLPSNGEPVKLYIRAEHTKNTQSPLGSVQEIAQRMTEAGIVDIYSENRAWWKDYWLQSTIDLDDDIQKYWYNHLYLMGSAARSGSDNAPGKAPGHWGPWIRSDDMMWFSNISMNYNGQNPYYGTFSANHVSLIDPYIETVRYYSENTGRKRVANRWVSPTIEAHMPPNCRGVAYELSFTSHGTSCGEGSWVDEDGSMPTNAAFGILPFVWKWKYGRDISFLSNVCYPIMLDVADFFDDYIGTADEQGQYHVYGAVHEGRRYFTKNDMFSLGAIRFVYREILAASLELGRDENRREHWQDILHNMSKYPLQEWENTITFRPDWENDVMVALSYQGGARNTGIMFTTTFDNISHHTLPAYKIAACNTLDRGNMLYPQRFSGWQDSNDFGIMFVMAVRAGYPPHLVIEAIKGWIPEPNGIVSQKQGGGIETAGIVEAINNMLLQSHDGVIRVFPNWDRTKDAKFSRLRAMGAFLVEAQYTASEKSVSSLFIHSEKGYPCVVQSPWQSSCLTVSRADNGQAIAGVQTEDEFSFPTVEGVTYRVTPAECPTAPEGSPVITSHPDDTTVVLPSVATFTVSAAGEGLRYQWQKNRVDIPSASSASYTTPVTTLWDIGSQYRCVITNPSGVTISNHGVLNPGSATYLGAQK